MAVTQNLYTGNGSTVLYSFTFPYLETTDIKVSVNGTNTTAYTLANATTIQFNTAPVNGAAIRIYRQTDDTALPATFYSGSAIRANDLNENFTQNLYVTQESTNNAASATSTANTALTNSNTAISTANTALSQSTTALSNSSTALSQSNTAISDSATALSQSNTAISDSASAVSTAATASSNASTALSQSNTALSNSSTALSQSTTALSNSTTAVSTASSAVSTANTALSTANAAQSTANTADANANAALNAIAGTVQYVLVANVAAIPGSPANGDAIEIADSTGIESFSPLTNRPAGFVGDSGLSVRLQYLSAGSSWNWLNYFPNNAETRYLKLAGGTLTGQLRADDSTSVAAPVIAFDGDTNTGIAHTGADELALVTGGTARVTIDPSGNVAVSGGLTKGGNNVVTVGDSGTVTSTMIADGTIVNGDINASAAIAGSKISPDFGSQNVTTTGTVTGASLNPTSSTVPTNGVYLPAANSVAISTGGSGRLFVDANGNIGVKVAAPSFVSGYTGLQADGGSNGSVIKLTNSTTGSTSTDGFDLILQQGGSEAYIWQRESAPLIFGTAATERMRLDSSGRLGVGTSSPSSLLHLAATVPELKLSATGGATARLLADGSALYAGTTGAHDIRLETDGTTRLFIAKTSGNVGIGSSSPGYPLTVKTTTDGGQAILDLDNQDAGNYGGLRVHLGKTDRECRLEATYSSSFFSFYTDSAERMRLTSTGLGIGTTTFTTDCRLSIGSGALNFIGNSTAPNASTFIYRPGDNSLGLGTDGLERCRLDSSGRLLIGTSSAPTGSRSQFSRAVVQSNSSGSGHGVLSVLTSTSAASLSSGNEVGQIVFGSPDGDFAWIQAFTDAASGSNDYPGRLVFSVSQDGSASPTERVRLDNAGNFFVYSSGSDTVVGGNAAGSGTNQSVFTGVHSRTSTTGGGTVCYRIYNNGTTFSVSDARQKKNIETARDGYLEDLQQLRVVKYNWLDQADTESKELGLIAQEVAEVFPGLVQSADPSDPESTLGIKSSVFSFMLIKALQEAMERIETLEAKVAALESA